ncbi:hypothetical protein Vadar_003133 [Vaccinium darrowii]|uniref:Uncharacterized protein n=1 Tax=Vaccinium darrowii TaxID=229202 RepID=A0ACB7ZGT1_9ERIC|nr:hypothetical protein Vadar_003133 [Vaccinium darrowii]
MCSIPFTTVDDANKLLIVLLQRAHPCLGVPKPQIRSDHSEYFVDIEKRTGGVSLQNFLRTSGSVKMLKPEATQTSPALLNMISNLIGVTKKLQDSGFMCSYKVADITVFYEQNDKNSVQIMVNDFQAMKDVGEDWNNLKTLIQHLNTKTGVLPNLEMQQLFERIGARNITGIFELPLFWSLNDKRYFLYALCTYLKSNERSQDQLWTSSKLENAFGSNCDWYPKASGNQTVKEFVIQDKLDRQTRSLAMPHQGVPADKLLGIIEFMRDCLDHFQRMKQDILNRQRPEGSTGIASAEV